MDQWCSSLLSAFARDLVCGAKNELRYPCCFNGFVKDLEGEQVEFIKTKESVNNRVDRAKKQAMKNEKDNEWLEGANALEAKVKGALNRARTTKTCCFGHCPNWIRRYRQAKELEKVKKELEEYNKKGDEYAPAYERVASLPGTEHLPREECFEFESRGGKYAELIEALKDDNVSMVGLYGMGGSGKTTMALKLKSTAEAEHLFDKVLFVPVSSNVQVRGIQDKIASALQFQFPEGGESERARRLCKRLIDEKRTLVILDDVWGKLDLGAIGIPVWGDGDNYFCKVLITTRSLYACTQMNCMRRIPLSILTDQEAWELFQKQANIYYDTDTPINIKMLGKEISNECKGLPVAIAALAGTLKDKVEADWKIALDRLRNSTPVDIEIGYENPYKCLEVSYNNLSTDEAKSLFLLCSVFPEDYEIPVETLTIYAIGLGLIGREVRSFEMARNEVSAAKNKLINSSLLSLSVGRYDKQECVKMHDLIRDVAHWIAKKDEKEIKCVLEEDVTLKCSSSSSIRYLWCKIVPNNLDCSYLEFLWLETKVISYDIFKGMERLRVFCLRNLGHKSHLTLSFLKPLTNLHCLVLSWWDLYDMSYLGHLTKLESLMLFECSFSELPDVVTQLLNLKLLGFTQCRMNRNSFQVIGKHLKLEELYYDNLWVYSYGADDFPTFSVPPALQRFVIRLGYLSKENDDNESLDSQRSLHLSSFYTSNAEIMELAQKAEVLHAINILGDARSFIPDIFRIENGGEIMNYGWIDLFLCDSHKIVFLLVDNSNHSGKVLFSKLRWLRIKNMWHLRALYHGRSSSGLFQKLEKLCIDGCPMLTSLLSWAAARSLVELQELEIISCEELEHIVGEDISSEISGQDDNKLVFSKLKSIKIVRCSKLEHTIPFIQGLVQLERLHIEDCASLEYVFGQGMHQGNNSGHQNALNIELPILEHVELRSNPKVIRIFPSCSAILMCPSMKSFRLEECPEFDIMCLNTFEASSWKLQEDARTNGEHFHHALESLYVTNNFKVESIFSIINGLEISGVSLGLQRLNLSDLGEMKHICVRVGLKNSFTFKNLEELTIHRCEKLEVIFHASVVRSLPELKELVISECQALKQIIEDDDTIEENEKSSNNLASPQSYFPKLVSLYIYNCNNLRRLFCTSFTCNRLPNLWNLVIVGARELEELIGGGCQRLAGQREKVRIELPELRNLCLMDLSSLCQGIELFPTQTSRLVHDCPKLSLTSSVTPKDWDWDQMRLWLQLFAAGGISEDDVMALVWKVGEVYGIKEDNDAAKLNEERPSSSRKVYVTAEDAEVENPNEERPSTSRSNEFWTTLSNDVMNIEETESETTTNEEIQETLLHEIPSSSIEDKIKESVQEACTPQKTMESATSSEIGDVCKGSIGVHSDYSSSYLVIAAELEACEHYVGI